MKSIISRFYSNYGFSFIYVILVCIASAHSVPSCGLYGAPPCQFVPAPPGQTPSCARPGRTYCEHADNYPAYLIKHLVHKWGYEAKNLLIDETWEEFTALTWHETPVFYDPAFIFPHQRPYNGGGGNGAYGSGDDFNGYKYGNPASGSNGGGIGSGAGSGSDNTFIITKSQTTETPTFLFYTSRGHHLNKNQVGSFNLGGGDADSGHKISSNSPAFWLKRVSRNIDGVVGVEVGGNFSAALSSFDSDPDSAPTTVSRAKRSISSSSSSLSSNLSRDVSLNMDLLDIVGIDKGAKTRTKRQTAGRQTLCKTTSQFITPQAALNNKGNWMYVVNEPSTARQMVKAELCASNTCSNLCQLPNGYNSRCEQKYVQKRLIALQADGQNLYTDSFWFPSCCVCTIAAN